MMTLLDGLRIILIGRDRAPATPRRWLRGVFAGLALVIALLAYYDVGGVPQPVRLALAAGVAVPVALLPRRPLLAWRIAMVATLVNLPAEVAPDGLWWPWDPAQVVILPVVVLLIAVRQPPAVVGWAGLLTAAAMVGHLDAARAPALVAVVLLAVIGDQVRRRSEAQRSLVAERELTQLEQARRAVLEERARIAREMHDVVAHHMSLIAVRAETAPYRLGDDPGERAAEFTAIAGASRDALNDMRRLLGVLRGEPDAPAPGLAAIPAMIEAAGAAGLDVVLEPGARTDAVPVTPTVEQSAYRIVQEGISNATRHAPGGAVRVTVTTDDRTLHLRVRNAAGTRAGSGPGGGRGLTGMRERAGALGGNLTAGPAPNGGYEIRAALPLAPPRK